MKKVFLIMLSALCLMACGGGDGDSPVDVEVDKAPKQSELSSEINGIKIVDAVYNRNAYELRFYSVPFEKRYDYPYYRIDVGNYDRFEHVKLGDYRVSKCTIHKVVGDNKSEYIYAWSVQLDRNSEYNVKESRLGIIGSSDPEWFSIKADITRLLDAKGDYIDNYQLRYEGKVQEVDMLTY